MELGKVVQANHISTNNNELPLSYSLLIMLLMNKYFFTRYV